MTQINKMNDSNVINGGSKELVILCYKVFAPNIRPYSVI